MKDQVHTTGELWQVVGEIKALMRMTLVIAAISGDVQRKAMDAAFSLQDIADNVSDYPAAMKVKIDLANRLNALMKSGTSLVEALDALRKEGWLDRLDSPDDIREAV